MFLCYRTNESQSRYHHNQTTFASKKCIFISFSFYFSIHVFVCKYSYFYNGKRFRIHPLKKNVQQRYKVRTVFILSIFCCFVSLVHFISMHQRPKKQRLENRQAGKSRRLLLFSQGFFSSGFYYLCM